MTSAAAPSVASGQGAKPPRHVAIIMDGNGRWAKRRLLPRIAGHKKGVEAAKTVARAAGDLGVEVLTLYAFSTENWRRPPDEVSDLMGLLRHFIEHDVQELSQNGVRLKIIGDYKTLQPDLVQLIDKAVADTAANCRTTLVIALNYGSQAEIARAAQALAQDVASGAAALADIDAAAIEARLYTADLPPPDLVIRTSGEQRLSNFLLWQAAYAELMFVDTLWPDFGKAHLAQALENFAMRERRFGGL
ncbi:MAG: isoprenyl transferase [Alphaproteobacteria bacterium]|nr:isoprenyl transferase [Alphaproteobacteria bacterium]